MPSNRFWRRWVVAASIVFAVQSVAWILIGSFDPFGIYDGLLASALLTESDLPSDARKIYQFMLVLLGATSAGFFVLFAFVARHAVQHCEAWARKAMIAALLTWFILDSGFSLAVGAAFNVFLVNIPCLLILGIPLTRLSTERSS